MPNTKTPEKKPPLNEERKQRCCVRAKRAKNGGLRWSDDNRNSEEAIKVKQIKKTDSLRGRREAQGSQQGAWRRRVPCAELTLLTRSQSDSVGLCDRAEVIANDVITESGECGPFNVQQSADKPKQYFRT